MIFLVRIIAYNLFLHSCYYNVFLVDMKQFFGVEIVPVKDLADEMSTGVSYFEQFVWDLNNRGISNIDLPVLILGIVP